MATRTTLPPHLQARYGLDRRSPWRFTVPVILAVVFAATLGAIGWRLATPGVSAQVIAWRAVDDTNATLTFEVDKPADRPAFCAVRAQDEQYADVAYAIVSVPGAGLDYVQTTVALATSSRPFVIDVLACSAGDPPTDLPEVQLRPGTSLPRQLPPAVSVAESTPGRTS